MKKILLIVFVLTISSYFYLQVENSPPEDKIAEELPIENKDFLQTDEESVVSQSAQQILASDYQKIVKNLKKENISGEEWKVINDYSLSPQDALKKGNATEFFKSAQNNVPDIFSCLKKDFCGMETRGDDDPYFDDQRTPSHIMINRNLKIIKESLRQNKELQSQVNWQLMKNLALEKSELLSIEAIEIISEFNQEITTSELIGLTKGYKGPTKAGALAGLSKRSTAGDKKLLADEVAEVFSSEDNYTVISVLENLPSYSLSGTELEKAILPLCRYKDMEEEEHNWLMIQNEAKKVKKDFLKYCN